MSTDTTTYTTVTLADAQPGDEILAGGTWQPVAAFHLFGTSVKLVFPGGGTQTMPAHHCPKIRRAISTPTDDLAAISDLLTPDPWKLATQADTTATELLGAHTHYLAGADTLCSELTHCPSLCRCAPDACDAQRATPSTPAAPEVGCYSMNLATGRVCTLDWGHDGAHIAHGMAVDWQPDGSYTTSGPRVIQTWERQATDRTATEAEAGL